MPNKYDLVSHLANLTFIFDAHEKLGTTKNRHLVQEFTAAQLELNNLLEKEHEARTSPEQSDGVDKSRAAVGSDLSRRDITNGEHGQPRHEAGTDDAGPRVEGADGRRNVS